MVHSNSNWREQGGYANTRQEWLWTESFTRDTGHYILIKGSKQQDTANINIYTYLTYVSNNRSSKYMKQNTDRVEGTDCCTFIAGHFNTLLSIMDTITRQRVSEETKDLIQ